MAELELADEDRVRQALQDVQDPEVGESIVDMGLVDEIRIEPGFVEVVLVPTSAICPMSEVLIEDATAAVERCVPAGTAVDVRLDFDRFWTPDRMSPALRTRFGWSGP